MNAWTGVLIVVMLTVGPPRAGTAADASEFPTRPLRMLVPFAPGGGNDFLARLIGNKMNEVLGQQAVIDNRPGGGGIIANEIVARAPADGHTLLLGYFGPLAVSPGLTRVPYDPQKDFATLGVLASGYHLLVINPSVPARTVKELIALAKAQPGKLNSAFSGVGAAGHLATELFRSVVGIDIVHVPYRGSGPAAQAVMAGEAQMQFGSVPASLPYVRANRLIALATTSPRRVSLAPEVPTLIESGVTGVDARSWYVILAPAAVPPAILDKLSAGLQRILSLPDIKEQLARQAIEVQPMPAAEYRAFLRSETDKWGRVARAAGIKPE